MLMSVNEKSMSSSDSSSTLDHPQLTEKERFFSILQPTLKNFEEALTEQNISKEVVINLLCEELNSLRGIKSTYLNYLFPCWDNFKIFKSEEILTILTVLRMDRKPIPEALIKEIMERSETNDKSAQYILGRLFELGVGLKKDEKQAITWYTNAREQGGTAFQLIAPLYLTITGEIDECAIWLLMTAADAGDTKAQNILFHLQGNHCGLQGIEEKDFII
jgi:hypothetical protein